MSIATLPNLIVIGAMKAGTTSLHDYLNCHPDIHMSKVKEINYFVKEKSFSNGLDWYKNQFDANFKINGESSQDYSKNQQWKGIPKRIFDTLGTNTKFIYILRDPLERVYSHYREMQFQNDAPKSLTEYIKSNITENHYVKTSCYGSQLASYLEYFPIENFKLITLEDLITDRLTTMNELFTFLDLNVIEDKTLFDFEKNKSAYKKSRNSIGNAFANNPILSKVKKLLPTSSIRELKSSALGKRIFFKGLKNEKIPLELEELLRNEFKKDLKEIEKLTKIDFSKKFINY